MNYKAGDRVWYWASGAKTRKIEGVIDGISHGDVVGGQTFVIKGDGRSISIDRIIELYANKPRRQLL